MNPWDYYKTQNNWQWREEDDNAGQELLEEINEEKQAELASAQQSSSLNGSEQGSIEQKLQYGDVDKDGDADVYRQVSKNSLEKPLSDPLFGLVVS